MQECSGARWPATSPEGHLATCVKAFNCRSLTQQFQFQELILNSLMCTKMYLKGRSAGLYNRIRNGLKENNKELVK